MTSIFLYFMPKILIPFNDTAIGFHFYMFFLCTLMNLIFGTEDFGGKYIEKGIYLCEILSNCSLENMA